MLVLRGVAVPWCRAASRRRASTVDVADEDYGGFCVGRHFHIYDVAVAQVYFGWGACSFEDYDVVFAGESVVVFGDCFPDFCLIAPVFLCFEAADWLAVYDYLRSGVGFWFQQHGVHVGVWFDSGCLCLNDLGAAHFSAVGGDVRVVGHVLRFEWRYFDAVLGEDAAEGWGDDAFAD